MLAIGTLLVRGKRHRARFSASTCNRLLERALDQLAAQLEHERQRADRADQRETETAARAERAEQRAD